MEAYLIPSFQSDLNLRYISYVHVLMTVTGSKHERCLLEEEMLPKRRIPSSPSAVKANWFRAILFWLSLVFRVLGSLIRARGCLPPQKHEVGKAVSSCLLCWMAAY